MSENDLVVIGAGGAGLAAALEGGRLGLRTTLIDNAGPGGLLMNAGVIDGCPGLAEGLSGPDLVARLTEQVMAFDVTIEFAEVSAFQAGDGRVVVHTDSGEVSSRTAVIATGGAHRHLGVPLESELDGRGISHCAVCDGAMFAGKESVVIGGGDHALESALYLSDLCPRVTIIHRGGELRAADTLQKAARARPNLEFLMSHAVEAFAGGATLEQVAVRDLENDTTRIVGTAGAFVCIGITPRTDVFADTLKLDDHHRIVVDLDLNTSLRQVFAAGVVRSQSPDQLITALADGVTATRSAFRVLQGTAV